MSDDKKALADLVKERAKLKAEYKRTGEYRTHLKLVIIENQIKSLKGKS